MTKNEFMEAVKDATLEILRANDEMIDAVISNVTKPNNIVYSGLSFRGSNNIQPVVYLDSFFERYEHGDVNIQNVAKTVADIYMSNKWRDEFDIESITDFQKVKSNIMPCIYNTAANLESLKTVPSREVVDLSMYYRIEIPMSDKQGDGFVTIHNNLLVNWNITEEELYAIAWDNLRNKHKHLFKSLFDVLVDTMGDELLSEDMNEPDVPMYVLTTDGKSHGAVYMTDMELLSKISDKLDDDLVILPSSRHEVIILKMSEVDDYERLKEMVMEVNKTQVSREDYLSDSVYRFDRKKNALSIAA